jgi:dihydroneopterin aldolase
MDIIFLRQLQIDTVIGIHDWEREIRQPLVLDLEMASDIRLAAQTDSITDALDYQSVAERLTEFVRNSSFQLVETLAEACAQIVLQEFGVRWLRLTVNKPDAIDNAQSVGVIIERGSK